MDEKIEVANVDLVQRYLTIISILLNTIILISSLFVITEVNGVEDNVIHTIQTIISDNNQLYTNPDVAPYAITQYAPLYYIICDTILSVLGVGADADPYLIKVISRCISLLFIGLCLIYLQKIFLEHTGISIKDSNIFLLAFVTFTSPWFYIARPDGVIAFFTILAVYLSFNYFATKQGGVIFLTGIVSFLAFFSKQNGAFLGAAVGFFLLITCDIKGAIIFTVGIIVGALAGFLLLELMHYNSPYLYQNIIKGIDNGTSIVSFMNVSKGVSLKYGIFIIICFIASICLLKSDISKTVRFTLYLFCFFFSFALAISFKIGSSENYFLDFLMIGFIIWAFFINKFLFDKELTIIKQWILLLLVIMTISINVRNIIGIGFANAYDWYYYIRNKDSYLAVDKFIGKELIDGVYYFSDDMHIQLMSPKHVIFPDNDIVTCCTFPLGTFSYTNFSKDVNGGKLKFIISFKSSITDVYGVNSGELYGVDLRQNFTLYKEIGEIKIYKNVHAVF